MVELKRMSDSSDTSFSDCVVILSGGMDSTTLLYDVLRMYKPKYVTAISFNYNQKHKKEAGLRLQSCFLLWLFHTLSKPPF